MEKRYQWGGVVECLLIWFVCNFGASILKFSDSILNAAQIFFLPSLSCNSLSYYHTHDLEICVIPKTFIFQLKSRAFFKEGLTFFPNPSAIHMRSCSSFQKFHSIHDYHGCLHLTDWFISQRALQQPQRLNLLTSFLLLKTGLHLPPRICYFFRITILKGGWFHRLPNTTFILFLCHSCCGHSYYRTRECQGKPCGPLVFHVFSSAFLWKQHFILWALESITCCRMIPSPKCSFLLHKYRLWSYCITSQGMEDTRRS